MSFNAPTFQEKLRGAGYTNENDARDDEEWVVAMGSAIVKAEALIETVAKVESLERTVTRIVEKIGTKDR